MNDLISRQETIDIINTYAVPIRGYIGTPNDSEVYAYARGLLLSIERNMRALPSAQQWIPCSDRLPEEYGNYLITTHDGNVDIGTIDPKKKSVWSACDADGFYWLREVVAWMPLPKPYERKES